MGLEPLEDKRKYYPTMRGIDRPTFAKPLFAPSIMQGIMLAKFEQFISLGTLGETKAGRHIYIDRGSKVLGVAHLDSVQSNNFFWINHQVVACPTIDNRLGAWILLQGLPSMGIYPDILLTENEERGASTGGDFNPSDKRWGWMFSFDRKATDTVFYRYGGGELEKAIKEAGFEVGHGSYSCINSMSQLGVEGVNVGCGMADYHSRQAHASLDDITSQLQRFATFYRQHEETTFTYTPRPEPKWTPPKINGWYDSAWSDEWEYNYYYARDKGKKPKGRKGKEKKVSLVMEKAMRACDRLMDEARSLETVVASGLSQFLDGEIYVGDWQEIHRIEGNILPSETGGYCQGCRNYYLLVDMKFSHYKSRLVCRGCWLDLCDDLRILPTTHEQLEQRNGHLLLPISSESKGTEDDSHGIVSSSTQEDAPTPTGQGGDDSHKDGQ